MDLQNIPIGFGLALSANTAAMNRYAALTDAEKQAVLKKAHTLQAKEEIYSLVADLANG